ncbi:MAG: hypothetical protein IKH15_12020 [Bacteroidales bacterium]|nr:hypothetical protein [Bacteroidales bacterium]
MKFTKEEAVEKLNQALTNGGKKPLRVSARTLSEHTENLMSLVADEEMELDDFVTKVKPMLESVNSNMEKDRSDFIKEYEKENPKPKTDPKDDKGGKDDPDKTLLEKLQEQLNEIQEQTRKRNEQEALATKKAEIRKYLDDNNVKDTKWIDSMLSVAAVGKDDDAEEKGKTLLELYNQSREGAPITPLTPKTGAGTEPDAFDAVRKLRKSQAEAGK